MGPAGAPLNQVPRQAVATCMRFCISIRKQQVEDTSPTQSSSQQLNTGVKRHPNFDRDHATDRQAPHGLRGHRLCRVVCTSGGDLARGGIDSPTFVRLAPSSCSCRGWPPSRSCGDAHEAGGRSRGASDSPHLALSQRGVVVSRGLFVLGRGEQSIPFFLLNVTLSGGARQSERTRDGGRGGWLARIPAARAALANELSSSDNHRRARLGALAHAGNPDGLQLSRDPERDEVARTSPP